MDSSDSADRRFAALYERYRRHVEQSLRRIGVADADIDDLAQDVFCVVLRRAAELSEYDRLHGWLRAVVRRVAGNHRRAIRRRDRNRAWPWADGTLEDPEHAAIVCEATRFLAAFVEALDETARDVFVLSEIEGLRGPEVARRVGLELDATYGRIRRVRQRFRDAMTRERLAGAAWLAALPRTLELKRIAGAATVPGRVVRRQAVLVVTTAGALAGVAALAIRPSCDREGAADRVQTIPSASDRIAPAIDGETDLGSASVHRTRIAGRVLDLQDRPIAGARVCAARPQDEEDRRCIVADREGRYVLHELRPGTVLLVAGARGWVPVPAFAGMQHRRIDLRPGDTHESMDLVLRPGGREVTGHVLDILGGGIEGAQIFAMWGDTPVPSADARSDADGRFSVWVDAENMVIVRAEADGYVPESELVYRPTGDAFELVLYPESALEGCVVDAATGRGVPDVPVVLRVGPMAHPMLAASRHVHAQTDADGCFRIGELRPGRYKPAVQHGPWLGQATAPVELALGETIEGIEIRVHPARQIEGRIEWSDGSACTEGNALVRDAGDEIVAANQTDPDGTVRFGGLMPGIYTVVASCGGDEGTPSAPLEIGDADLHDLRFVVDRRVPDGTLSLLGNVTGPDGAPIAFATVEAVRDERLPDGRLVAPFTQTDRSGAYRFDELPPGRYRLRVSAGGFAVHERASPIAVEAPQTRADVELPAGGTLRILTVDPAGDPVGGVEICIGELDALGGSWIKTDRSGWAEIGGLPAVEHGVRVSRPGVAGRAGPEDPSGNDPQTPVAILAGATTDLVLTVPARSGVISGRAVRTDGDPVADADVIVRSTWTYVTWTGDDKPALVGRARTDAQGEFKIEELEPEAYELVVRDAFGQARSISAKTDDEVEVVLPVAGSLAGIVTRADGSAPSFFSVTIEGRETRLSDVFVATDGEWSFVGVPAGRATVSVTAAEGRAETDVTIPQDGSPAPLRLRLGPRADVAVQIVDEDGDAIAGAHVLVCPAHAGASCKSAITNADGDAAMQGVASGDVTIKVLSPAPLRWRTFNRPATLEPGKPNTLPPIRLAGADEP